MRVNWRRPVLGAYLLVVLSGVVGFLQVESAFDDNERQDIQQCEASKDVRQAVTDVVNAIYSLAMNSIPENPTPEQEEQIVDYKKRLETFKKDALANLHIPDYCK